ncbi:MAG TPA: porin [Dongiaceae bacterium]|nr:porin [Dongiaceae bacterium]
MFKRILLGTTALLTSGLFATAAHAADGIKLTLGGFFRTAIQGNIDNNGKNDLGHGFDSTGVFSDAEIYFLGRTTLDNGLTIGTRVELEGEQKDGDQIDAAYVYFQGGMGEVRIGSQYGALGTMCVTPPGGTNNFGAFSQDEFIGNAFNGWSAGVCNSIDAFRNEGARDKSQKIVYMSPSFGGFQLSFSWAPNGAHESTGVSNGHTVMPTHEPEDQRHVVDAYANYSHDFDGWGLSWGGGGSWTLQDGHSAPNNDKGAAYQSGLNLTFGDFSIGGAGEYYKNSMAPNQDVWVVDGGASYKIAEAWTVGLQYSFSDFQFIAPNVDRRINLFVATAQYDMGPGIALDAMMQFGWVKADEQDKDANNYTTYGIGIGTSFDF